MLEFSLACCLLVAADSFGCWHSHPPLCSGCCVLCPLIASAYPQAPVGVVVGTATISPLALFPNVAFGYQHERVGLIVMDKQILFAGTICPCSLGLVGVEWNISFDSISAH